MLKTFIFILKLIYQNLQNKKLLFWLSIINAILTGFVLFFIPFSLWKFIESLNNQEINLFYFYLFLWFSFWKLILNFIYRKFYEILWTDIELNFLKEYFIKYYNKWYLWHMNNSSWYITSMLKEVALFIKNFLVYKLIRKYVPQIIGIFLFFIYSFNLSPFILAYIVVWMFISFTVIRITYEKRYKLIKETKKSWMLFDKIFIDLLHNIQTLKKLYIKSFAVSKIIEKSNILYSNQKNILNLNSFQWFFSEFLMFFIFWSIIFYYLYHVVKTWDLTWVWIIITIYWMMPVFNEFNKEFMELLRLLSTWRWNLDLLKEKFFNENNEMSYTKEKIYPKSWKKIIVKNIKYDFFDNKNSLKIEELEILKWEKIAIKWKSWAWKTTLLNILANIIEPKSWEILIDDIEYKSVDDKFFEDNFLYISQDVELFDLTLKENISLWNDISNEKIFEILENLWMKYFLERIGYDLNVLVWEKWIKLSAWEKQRINIARWLLFTNKEIILLDEITANLDKENTKKVWNLIFDKFKDKTVIVVSHEEQIFDYVDKKIVLKNNN